MTDVKQTPVATTEETKETYLWQATLAQEAKRYEDMAMYMRRVAECSQPMTREEDNMLAAAYKHVLDAKRSAKRTLASVEEQQQQDWQEEQGRGQPERIACADEWRWKTDVARRYRDRVDGEVRVLCADMLAVVRGRQSVAEESADETTRVFYRKLRADYHRYAAEATERADDRAAAIVESRAAYEQADNLARQSLRPIDPVRLGLMLNYSVFLYQVCGERRRGHDVAKGAFDEAVAEIDAIDDRTYDDATLIMRLIRDNLSIWADEGEGEDGSDGRPRADDPSAAAPSDEAPAVTPLAPPPPPLPLADEPGRTAGT